MTRKPIEVQRKPITVLSDAGLKKSSGWYVFSPKGTTIPKIKTKRNEEILWCPFCGSWNKFKARFDDRTIYECQGDCKFANTKEFYVRMTNNLWYLGVRDAVKDRDKHGLYQ